MNPALHELSAVELVAGFRDKQFSPVEVARSVPETEWQRRVEQCGGNALHLSAPHRAEQDPRDQRFLIFTRDQEIVACAIAFERRRRLWGRVPQGPPTLWMPTAPAMLDGGLAPDVLDALVTHENVYLIAVVSLDQSCERNGIAGRGRHVRHLHRTDL